MNIFVVEFTDAYEFTTPVAAFYTEEEAERYIIERESQKGPEAESSKWEWLCYTEVPLVDKIESLSPTEGLVPWQA